MTTRPHTLARLLTALVLTAWCTQAGCGVDDALTDAGAGSGQGTHAPRSTAFGGPIAPQGGTVTGITAGTGLSGGGAAGPITVSADTTYLQRRVVGVCAAGTAVGTVNADGTVTCNTAGGSITTSSPLAGDGSVGTPATLALCTGNQVVKMNAGGTAWACAVDNDTTYTAGTGLALSGGAFSLATIATNRILGNTSGSTAAPTAQTGTQVTAILDAFSSTLKGLAPASGGGTANYLRADGTWATPPGTGVTGTGAIGDLTAWTGTGAVGNFAGSTPAACAAGTVLTQVTSAATGAITLTCTAIGTAGGTTGTGTTNTIPKWTSATGFGNSSITDDGTGVVTPENARIASGTGTATALLSVGRDPALATGVQNGWQVSPYSDGNNYIDSKTYTGGSTIYRVGAGAQVGSATTWLTVANGTGNASFTGSTTLGDAAADTTTIHGTTVGVEDGTYLTWDTAGSDRLGFTKKATFAPKLTYGSATTFAISESTAATIAATNTFTDRLTIDTAGNVAIPSGTLSMGSHQINLVTDPTLAQDAATKNYVDTATTNEVTGTLTSGKMPVATGAHAVGDSIAAGTASGITIDNGTATNVSQLQLKRNAVGNIALTNLGGGNEYIQFGAHYDGTNYIADDTTGVSIGKYGAGPQFLIGTNAFQTVGSVTSFQNRALLNLSTGALELTGAITLDSTLHTVGAATLDSTLAVTGLVDFTGQSVYLGRQVFTASATYTPTTGTRKVRIRECGGGGGGGGAATAVGAAGGGASGGWMEKWINPGAAITGGAVTIGAAGTGGAITPTAGGNGGATSLVVQATTYTASGGNGGALSAPIALGGTPGTGTSAGDVSTEGDPGGWSASTATVAVAGKGGTSPYGGGGAPVSGLDTSSNGNAGSGRCSGGGGGAKGTAGTATGGAGTAGLVIVDEYR